MTTLGAVLTDLVDCEHKTAPLDDRGQFFAVGTPAMAGNVIDYSQARRISQKTYAAWTRRLAPKVGDLLLAREAPVGPVVEIPPAENVAPGQRTVLMRPNPRAAHRKYLFYALSAPSTQAKLREKASGSTVAHLNVADIRAFEFPWCFPTMDSQRAIAEVLGALDDKIAANDRLVSNAVALADMQFHQCRSRSERAPLCFDEVATISGGATPSTKVADYWDGNIPWATPTDVTALRAPYLDDTARKITDLGLANCSSALFPVDSILMTSRATIGAFALAKVPVAVNQGFVVAQAKQPFAQYWLLHEMRHRVDDFLLYANGATFLELSKGRFRTIEVGWPVDAEPLVRFEALVRPLHGRAYAAQIESRHLAALRDTLLPHLMSGRITVRDAEETVEGVL